MSREGYHRRRPTWTATTAQRRVLDALTEGLTNAEIAVRLHVSPETVKWHIGELLAETGLLDRQALAGWWRQAADEQGDRRGLALPASLLARVLSLVGAILLGAVAVRLLLPGGEADSPVASPPLEQAAESEERVAPGARPFVPDAWVFDVANRTAQAVPVSVWAAQWYEPGESLLAKAGQLQVIVDLQGNVLRHFGQESDGGYISVKTAPIYGEGVLVWRWREATLARYDSATDQEQLLLRLEPAPPGRRIDLEVSPDRTKIAYTQVSDAATSLVIADAGGGNATTVLSRPADDEIWIDDWSPDSRHILARTGTRTDCRDNNGLDICTLVDPSVLALDMSGNVVWQRDGGLWWTHWMGPERILVEDQVLAVQILASMGLADVCATPERPPGGLPSCLYTVQPGETLESIADRFGIEPDGQMFQVTLSGTLPLVGESPQVSPGDILSIPAPLEGSLIDLLTGKATPLDLDVRGLICISPDGATGIFQSLTIEPRSNKVTARTTAIDLATGQTIVETPVAHGLITCTDRSWTPDGSMVVLSSWGK